MLSCIGGKKKVLQSSQAQDYSSSSENVTNLEAIKKDLLNCEDSLLRIHQPINEIVYL